MIKILIMGLPGSGKTTLARRLSGALRGDVLWLNADALRQQFDDWDFSHSGRIRQAQRMRYLADGSRKRVIVADFAAPLIEQRDIFEPDIVVWMNTISESRFDDTNRAFAMPLNCDVRFDRFKDVALSPIINLLADLEDKSLVT